MNRRGGRPVARGSTPLLATTPRAPMDVHLDAFFRPRVDPDPSRVRRTLDVAGLLDDDARILRELRRELIQEGASAAGAATAIAAGFAGIATSAIAYVMLASGAAPIVDAAGLRWSVSQRGWAETIEVGDPRVLIPPAHPWVGHPKAVVVRQVGARCDAVVEAISDAVRPLVDACHRLGGVGRAGLWNEVGDGFASVFAYDPPLAPTEDRVKLLRRLVASPKAPWRTRPRLRVLSTPTGPMCVLRKGGCCLVFTGWFAASDDDDDRAYRARFGDPPQRSSYCATCPRRTFDDCEARQRWWHERARG